MAKYSNLKFFDSNSDELNLTYDSTGETWQGIVYLPEVSTGLYETLTVYILQETIGSLGETKYVTPLAETSSANNNIQVSFQNEYDSSENIILYSSAMEDGELYIKTDKSQLKTRLASSTSSTTNSDGFRIVSSSLKSEPIQINVALKSDEETYHKRTLLINEINATGTIVNNIATIRVYGETVGEDERLETLLSNIGMSLSPTDHFVFEDADIRESSPDWKLINRKRRELLLEAANIKPFIGTYKALLNAIKYFGYENITLTEYWLNINETAENFGKLKAVAIPNQDVKGFLAAKNSTSQLPNSNLKKTSRFSLVYRLNNATGEYDEWDIPKVKEALDFSPDEVLIKLYGLKNRLQKSYIPMQAKIVDIVGEADYFSQFNINTWNNQQNISTVNEGVDVGYEVFPDRGLYLEDLRKVSQYLTGKGQDFKELEQTASGANWPTTKASIKSFYGVYEETDMSTFSDLDIPVGCPIILKVNSFKDTWEDCKATYDDANDGMDITHGILASSSLPTSANSEIGQLVLQNTSGVYAQLYFDGTNWIPFTNSFTWDKWWHKNIYEIEWRLIGPNGYDRTFRGPISNDVDDANPGNTPNPKGYREFLLTLPYTGKYSVELAFYDLYNVRSVKFDKDVIEVKSKEVETYGITQSKSPVLNWNGYHKYLWSTAGADWDTAAENTLEAQDFVGSYYLTLDRANYANSDNNWQHSTVVRQEDTTSTSGFSETAGPYAYKNMKKHDWNDGETMSWDMTRVGSDMLAAFKIDFVYGSSGQPGSNYKTRIVATGNGVTDLYTVINYPDSITDITKWTLVETELNALTSAANPWLSQFTYNLVIDDTDDNGVVDTCKYILAVAKKDLTTFQSAVSNNGIFPPADYHKVAVTHHNLHSSYNPSYVDTKVINQHDIYNKLNHFTFSFDNSKVPGIKTHEWSIKNNNKKITDIYYNNRWLTYVFDQKGDYTIGLKLTDVNGNKMETSKNILTIK